MLIVLLGVVLCSGLESSMLQLVNEYRRAQNMDVLYDLDAVKKAADYQASIMCSMGKLTHDGMDSKRSSLDGRLRSFDFVGENVGENIARQQNDDYKEVFRLWTKSEEHKHNILGDYTYTGISTCKDKKGNRFWVQVFGKDVSNNFIKMLRNNEDSVKRCLGDKKDKGGRSGNSSDDRKKENPKMPWDTGKDSGPARGRDIPKKDARSDEGGRGSPNKKRNDDPLLSDSEKASIKKKIADTVKELLKEGIEDGLRSAKQYFRPEHKTAVVKTAPIKPTGRTDQASSGRGQRAPESTDSPPNGKEDCKKKEAGTHSDNSEKKPDQHENTSPENGKNSALGNTFSKIPLVYEDPMSHPLHASSATNVTPPPPWENKADPEERKEPPNSAQANDSPRKDTEDTNKPLSSESAERYGTTNDLAQKNYRRTDFAHPHENEQQLGSRERSSEKGTDGPDSKNLLKDTSDVKCGVDKVCKDIDIDIPISFDGHSRPK